MTLAVSALLPRLSVAAEQPVLPADETSLAGRLIVAQPETKDPRFHEAVVFLVQHDDTGAFGIIVNKPLGVIDLAAALPEMGLAADAPAGAMQVHFGGPVDPTHGFVLHTDEFRRPQTMQVPGGYGVTTDPDVLRAAAEGRGPRRSLFAIGYSGWSAGQLEAELERRAWVVAPADESILFDAAAESKWKRAYARRFLAI